MLFQYRIIDLFNNRIICRIVLYIIYIIYNNINHNIISSYSQYYSNIESIILSDKIPII